MTDLLQGVMLLVTGCVILFLGVDYVGGFGVFWDNLPRGHRQAFGVGPWGALDFPTH